MQTIMEHCCVVFCTNDWRYKDEYTERMGKELIFITFLQTRNEGKRGSNVIDSKFPKFLCHTKPTLPSAMTVYKYQKRQYC